MTGDQLTDVDPSSVRVSVYRNLRTSDWSIKAAERMGDVSRMAALNRYAKSPDKVVETARPASQVCGGP